MERIICCKTVFCASQVVDVYYCGPNKDDKYETKLECDYQYFMFLKFTERVDNKLSDFVLFIHN